MAETAGQRMSDLPESDRIAFRDMFQQAPLNKMLDMEIIEIGERHAVVRMPVGESSLNHAGTLHGGALAALIDQAAGTAAARAGALDPADNTLVTADLHVRYLARTRGSVVDARAEVLRAGRQLITVECRVTDDTGELVAHADFSSMIVPRRKR